MLVGLLVAAGYVAWEAATWPNVRALKSRWPKGTAFIAAWERKHDGKPAWRMVPYARISPHLKRAVLVAEDIDFFSHDGFDLHEVRLAVREVKEAIFTKQLEADLGKRRILELYLNVVEFGPGVFGAEAAARKFYGKSAAALTEHEAAELAAGLPRSTWHPGVRSRSYDRYVSRIETRMGKAVFLWKLI